MPHESLPFIKGQTIDFRPKIECGTSISTNERRGTNTNSS